MNRSLASPSTEMNPKPLTGSYHFTVPEVSGGPAGALSNDGRGAKPPPPDRSPRSRKPPPGPPGPGGRRAPKPPAPAPPAPPRPADGSAVLVSTLTTSVTCGPR